MCATWGIASTAENDKTRSKKESKHGENAEGAEVTLRYPDVAVQRGGLWVRIEQFHRAEFRWGST
jgi:hypothetical protein